MNLILYFWLIFSRKIPFFPIVSRLIEHYVEIPVLRDYQMAYLRFRSVFGRDISIKATVSNIFLSTTHAVKFNAIYSWRTCHARKFGTSRRVNAVTCLAKCPRYFTVKSSEKRFYMFLLFLRSNCKYFKRRFSFEKLLYAKWNLFLLLYRLRRARRSVHSESYSLSGSRVQRSLRTYVTCITCT